MEFKELKEILIAQRELYLFLRDIITLGPQKETIAIFKEPVNSSDEEDEERSSLIMGIETIQKSLPDPLLESVETELMKEYTRLFIGPGKAPAYPYASVYLSKESKPKLLEESTIDVRKFYLDDHVVMTHLNTVPDDYLGAELEHITYLIQRSIECIEKEDSFNLNTFLQRQYAFLNDYLLPWVPRFSEDLIASTKEDFFRGIGMLLKGLVEAHNDIVREISWQRDQRIKVGYKWGNKRVGKS